MANTTYLNDVDTDKVEALMKDTEVNVKYFEDTSLATAKKYTRHLDELMQNLYKEVIKSEDVTTETIEKYLMELTNLIYFMGDKLEALGIYDDMSNASAKEVYNKAYLYNQFIDTDAKKKPTVAELTAKAEQASQYETVVNAVYEHAYKSVKFKIDAANKMVDVLRKILTHRMQEEAVSQNTYNPEYNYTQAED